MADASEIRTGNFLDALTHPTLVNPLAAYSGAADAARKVWDIRKSQAEQAAGEAAQGAIDPATGEYDPNRARTLLNQAGPGAALAAQQSLLNTQSMSNDQLKQAQSKASWLNAASGAALQSGDFSDAGMLRMFQSGIATGMFTLPEIQRQMAILPPDAAGRQRWLQEHQMTSASVQQQLDVRLRGGMGPEQAYGDVQVPYPKNLPDGSPDPRYGTTYPMTRLEYNKRIGGGGGGDGGSDTGSTGGLPPSIRYNPQNPNSTAPQAPNQPAATPNTPAAPVIPTGDPRNPTNVPGPPGGAAGTSGPYTGPGIGGAVTAAPSPAATPPPATATPPPPVTPAGPPRVPTAALQGGVPVASTNFLVPQTGAPSAPGPAVPGYVAAIQAGIQNARANPLAGSVATAGPGAGPTPDVGWGTVPGTPGSYGTVTPRPAPAAAPSAASTPAAPAPYFGTTANPADIKEMEGQAQRNVEGFNAISEQAVQSRNRSAILGNMLGDTTKFSTGPLTQVFATLRNVANRFGLPVDTTALASQEQVVKLGAQLANAQGANSDGRMALNIQANPHQELSPQGIDLMLRQLQGNEDYVQARAKIAQSSSETNIRNFEANFGSNLDPRAFQFQRMTPPQRQEYVKGLSAADRAAVQRSYNWAHGQGLVGG